MIALSETSLVRAWELGQPQSPARRALTLLELGFPDCAKEDLAALTIGARDVRLLALRALTVGPAIEGICACSACGRTLEVRTDTLRLSRVLTDTPLGANSPRFLEAQQYRIEFRLPTVEDTCLFERLGADEMAGLIFGRCVLAAHRSGVPICGDELPTEVRSAVEEAMECAEPAAEMTFELTCPGCSLQTTAPFDIGEFFWREIEWVVPQLFADVDILATRYGWSEAEIFAMSPLRRRCYLAMEQQ